MAQRISIGFQASPPLGLRVTDEELRKLEDALGGEGWHQISAEDGSVKLNLAHVLWLRPGPAEPRVGFGIPAWPPLRERSSRRCDARPRARGRHHRPPRRVLRRRADDL